MSRIKKESNKIQPTFNSTQIDMIRKYKGLFGIEDAEIVRQIVIAWMTERNPDFARKKPRVPLDKDAPKI